MPAKRAPAAPAKPASKTPGGRAKAQPAVPPPARPAKTPPKGKAAAGPARGKAAKQPASPPPPAKAPTIGTKQLADALAEKHQMPRKQAQVLVADLVGALAEHLRAGDKLRLGGLGTLQVQSRPARMGRNPATGESIQIAASKKISFRPAKELKTSV